MIGFLYLLPVLPTGIAMGVWMRDDPDYRDSPGMLGMVSLMGGLLWPLVAIVAVGVHVCTLFGDWLQEYRR